MTLPISPFELISPTSGRPLAPDRPRSVSDGSERWPVVADIPYLRVGRDALRADALAAVDAGDETEALAILLADQDDYARTPPPSRDELRRVVAGVDSGDLSLREAMAALNFGPVADYFAYRWSSPTYLSGLALLDQFRMGEIVEVACGIGHYLREIDRHRKYQLLGLDVVFSKLWLARRFLNLGNVPLVCGDLVRGLPLRRLAGSGTVFCHDAFYFLPDKPSVVASFRQLAGPYGAIVIGHAHNRNSDHGGVAGEPKTPAEYQAILPDARLFDDAALARSMGSDEPIAEQTAEELDGAEAVALVVVPDYWDEIHLRLRVCEDEARSRNPEIFIPRGWFLNPIPGRPLRLNPLLVERDGALVPDWPSERFRLEYEGASGYLLGEPMPSQAILNRAARGDVYDPEITRLARRRILLDLPERWGTAR